MRAWLRDLPDRHYAAFWTLMLALLLAMALVTIEAISYPPVKPAAVTAIVVSSMIGASLWGAAVYRARHQRAIAASCGGMAWASARPRPCARPGCTGSRDEGLRGEDEEEYQPPRDGRRPVDRHHCLLDAFASDLMPSVVRGGRERKRRKTRQGQEGTWTRNILHRS